MTTNVITVTINGQAREIGASMTIADFLKEKDFNPAHVVAEINGTIIPGDRFDDHRFAVGDTVELIRFVGGG
jgi:sulfur carrier protein